jgi:DeoR/GlpR family transcriptional regulator of sugar metabolism
MIMHDSDNLPLGRMQRIADRLGRGETVIAARLATEFGVSEDAIRRDLRTLAAGGVCRRVYGGALPLSKASSPIAIRSGEDVDRKRALARAAVGLVQHGQTLFLDTGSTNLQLAAELPDDRALTVLTNSIPAASTLMARSGISLVVIGGGVNATVGGCIGTRSVLELQRFQIDVCFLGACAISVEHGIAGFDLADADFKRCALDVSGTTVLMVTNAKLETAAPYRIARIADVEHLLLEHDAPTAVIEALRGTGVSIHIADAPVG